MIEPIFYKKKYKTILEIKTVTILTKLGGYH